MWLLTTRRMSRQWRKGEAHKFHLHLTSRRAGLFDYFILFFIFGITFTEKFDLWLGKLFGTMWSPMESFGVLWSSLEVYCGSLSNTLLNSLELYGSLVETLL